MAFLEKPPEKRAKSELHKVEHYIIKNFEFFQTMAKEKDLETLSSCCRIMQLQACTKGETVFNYGKQHPLTIFCA
jgi:UTP-glucose-1-phosphate uridylyltransferase